MATLHLLPRELLHLLAGSTRTSSARYKHLDSLASLQWPRFKSDYRKVDGAVAREFDRPMPGYTYPSSGSSKQHIAESAFMEDSTDEYSMSRQQEMRGSGFAGVAVAEATEVSTSRLRTRALVKVQQCLEAGDLSNALSWFRGTPQPARSGAVQEYQKVVRNLQVALLATEAGNIDLLCKFALTLAAKGFALHNARTPLLAHLARFSSLERLRPFWIHYSSNARTYAAGLGLMPRLRLERHLDTTANIMIRAQCLAARYVDAYNFLKHIRDEQIRGIRYFSSSARKKPVATIEEFTYTLLLEELSRHKAHPQLLEDVLSLAKKDWPDPIFQQTQAGTPRAWKRLAKPETTFGRTRQRYYDLIGEVNLGRAPTAASVLRLRGSLRRSGRSAALSAQLQKTLAVRRSKAAYHAIAESINVGIQPTPEMVEIFMEICRGEGAKYLMTAMQRKLAVPKIQMIFNSLKARMKEGDLPTANELRLFLESCRHSRALLLAKELGDWMMTKSTRYKSLWIITRMMRLVRLSHNRKALYLYGTEFSTTGLPGPIIAYLHNELGRTTLEQTSKLWPSSHGIALALKAWFRIDPSYSNIQTTYTAFLQSSYDSSPDSLAIPLSTLPDPVTYQAFIGALVDLGNPQDALQVMYDMRERGVMPSQHNWDTIIGGFAKAGKAKTVGKIIERMEAAMPAVDKRAISDIPDAKKVTDNFPSSASFDTRFETFFNPASTNSVRAVTATTHRSLDDFPFGPPTIVSYSTAIRGFCLAHKLEHAQRFKQQMFQARGSDGQRIYKWGTNAQADKALAILASMEKMQSRGDKLEERRSYALAPSLRR